ncbi:MAG: ribonuclease [Patescibacteria group bacterium]|nr:ribonuclease [Patescibacteria group bacterium]
MPCHPVIRADAKVRAVAAASIVAKVARDTFMEEQALLHPVYQFETHKGYGTAVHLRALMEHGPCVLHRRSFKPAQEALAAHTTSSP